MQSNIYFKRIPKEKYVFMLFSTVRIQNSSLYYRRRPVFYSKAVNVKNEAFL